MPSRSAMCTGPSRCSTRRCTILRTTGAGVRCGCLVRVTPRSRRPVHHPRLTLDPVAGGPLVRGLPRHVVPLRGSSDRPPLIDNQTRQPQPGARGQRSIGMGSVGQRRPPGWSGSFRQLHSTSGGLHPPTTSHRVVTQTRPTSLDITPRRRSTQGGDRKTVRNDASRQTELGWRRANLCVLRRRRRRRSYLRPSAYLPRYVNIRHRFGPTLPPLRPRV
jgi:hypothetical protein